MLKTQWFFVLVILLFLPSAYASTDFTDAQAKRYFEELWNNSCLKIPVGSILVNEDAHATKPPERFRPGQDSTISQAVFEYYNALASRGILHIETAWTDPNGGWSERQVSITQKGESLKKDWKVSQEEGWFCIKWGTSRLTNLGRNELIHKGLDVYRVIMLTSDTKWTPEYVLWEETKGQSISENRKSIVLLKHDPFLSKWNLITHDTANLDDEFKTNNVATELSR